MRWFEPHEAEEIRAGDVVVCVRTDKRGRVKVGVHAPEDVPIERLPSESLPKPPRNARLNR